MPRLIRRRPLTERIQAYLNPWDFLLWLSEELDTTDWEQWEKDWAIPLGITVNAVFLIARAKSRSGNRVYDDVFGDSGSTSWLGWFASFVVHFLCLVSVSNALYTFLRRRQYRLFEAPIEKAPSTPSAQRVQVTSSPSTSTPMRLLSNVLSGATDDRSHPRPDRDVWQVGVWDPHPLAMKLFCFFSPGHVLLYWLFLPISPADPRPSVTIVTTALLAALLSVQMTMFVSSFSQQSKDSALVHKEVLNEYDTKYVHPRTQPLMRSVATQYYGPVDEKYNVVEVSTPILMRQGYKISPNPNYVKHVDPESTSSKQGTRSARPSLSTPTTSSSSVPVQSGGTSSPAYADYSPSLTPRSAIRQPQFRNTPGSGGDGGSLGVYSHAHSPLRKAASSNFDNRAHLGGDYEGRDRVSSPGKRPGSPLKRSSVPAQVNTDAAAGQRWGHLANIGREGHGARRESGRI